MRRLTATALTMLGLSAPAFAALDLPLDVRTIAEAIAVGQTRIEAQRARFHAAYRLTVSRPPIDDIEVVTPFRRVALAAETHARAGNRLFGQREALEALDARGDQVDLHVAVTFHPLHTFILVPEYDVAVLGADGGLVEPRTLARVPRYGPRIEGVPLVLEPAAPPASADPMLGATVVAGFDGGRLRAPGLYTVLVREGTTELARVSVDLARLR